MKKQHEFFFNKENVKKVLMRNAGILILILILLLFLILRKMLNPFMLIFILPGILFMFYMTLKSWKQLNFSDPTLLVDDKKLIFNTIDYYLNFIETEIKIDDIKSIGTNIKMDREVVVSRMLVLKMLNSAEFTFNIELLGLTHDDMFKLIKELRPDAKLLNIGDFAYD
jgi:hypothetical protein